ncbi:unnamed protein product [Clavelina lepadiformis]|uniref:Uncharacterized protein n=1 Tax=Clavelina lepadiformis TaxID=159417 RepID=A0ABP0GIB0_CLALP
MRKSKVKCCQSEDLTSEKYMWRMVATFTYADRVKRQWNNDLAAEYCNLREVTIQLAKENKREDIYKLLKEIQIPIRYIKGIIQKPGNVRPEVKSATAYGDERIDLTIRWVPIEYPQQNLDEIPANFEIQGPAQLGMDKHGIKDGRRIYKGHKFKECPKRKQANTDITDEQSPPTTTSQISELVEENKSTDNAERSRPTARNPPKKSSKRDFNELTSEQQENRGNKRKDISGDSNENQKKPETQSCKNDHLPFHFTRMPLDVTTELRCVCRKCVKIRQSSALGRTISNVEEPVYCAGCDAVFVRCSCSGFSIHYLKNRYKPFNLECCDYTYEPNPRELNHTIN